MELLISLLAIGIPAILIGRRNYRSGNGHAGQKKLYFLLIAATLAIYVTLAMLDYLAITLFGWRHGDLVSGQVALIGCSIVLAVGGSGLLIGHITAVVQRAYRERDWARLKDLRR